ncbi:MSMEG_0572/Sll0783 family nitrogen starvation response protein [Neobacillus sp. 179-J 1A1 HS]|jgi:uncharacterized repeat protein (TIGR04044 family)|uniref:MSMEG_0572/Sll0783 family nitrogen starvation response protein n=1 Tax=Neobacillus driksii TaxID=3035913 RepID=UPI0035BC465F
MANLTENELKALNEIPHPALEAGTRIYGETKVFPDHKANPGEKFLSLVHGVAHESSLSYVAVLQAIRAQRKGFETAIYFYGTGAINATATRGYPVIGKAAFGGQMNWNEGIEKFIKEGGKVYVCRFGLGLHGIREEDLIEGTIPCDPLDLQDCLIEYHRSGAFILSTFQI